VDLATLERFSRDGFAAVTPDELNDLWRWCWDWCEATGDARFCSLADLFRAIDQWWEEYQVVSTTLARTIESRLVSGLDDVLTAESADEGCHFARLLRQDVLPLLRPPADWPA
jgi:5'-deoxynucleotidase YfbR-like HD superfamily hydrolase